MMESEKRALLAIALTFAFLFLYQVYLTKKYEKKAPEIPVKEEEKLLEEMKAEEKKEKKDFPLLKMSTPLFTFTLSRENGGISSFRLKNYLTDLPPKGVPVELVEEGTDPLPLQAVIYKDDKIIFPSGFTASTPRSDSEKTFFSIYSITDSVLLEERWTLNHSTYRVDVDFILKNLSPEPHRISLQVLLGRKFNSSAGNPLEFFVFEKGNFSKFKGSKLKGGREFDGNFDWIGSGDKYFLNILIPQRLTGIKAKSLGDSSLIQIFVSFPPHLIPPGLNVEFKMSSYLGPRREEDLQNAMPSLKAALDMGFLAGSILKLLKFFYRLTGNYGFSIILISLIVKIIFWPLSQISYKSMKKMKEVQPLLEQIKKKYGEDKEKIARETMEIYRKYKVNPFSGCLPLLIQLPVFIALYNALMNSIELRHAPFILWIKDLSSPELLFTLKLKILEVPVRFLPVLMGVTMYIQQKLTPTTGTDPLQVKMMNFMSLFLVILFWNFPSGLMIYWIVQNVMSIVQQLLVLRRKGRE